MDSNEDMEYLEHYGVLGMHWGIRRYQPYPKGHKGDGRFLGETKKRLAQAGRTVTRTASRAGRAAVTKAKNARQAYKESAPEREVARFERRIANRKEKAYRHPERLSDEELAARIERLKQEKEFKELTDEVIHPGKKRVEQYQDRIVNRVIDRAVDKAVDKAFDVAGEKLKGTSKLEKMQKEAKLAEAKADIAKSEADYRNQRNRLERLEDGSYEKSGKKGEKDYIKEKTSGTSSSNQNEGKKEPKQTGSSTSNSGDKVTSKSVSSISSSSSSSTVKRVLPASASTKLSGHEFKTGSSKGREYVKLYMNNGDGTATGKFPDARYKAGYRTETINTKR